MSTTNYKEFLLKTHQNLQILQEREAKSGGDASLSLLNQIDDHKKAIALTEQAINGEIGEEEWQLVLDTMGLNNPVAFGKLKKNKLC